MRDQRAIARVECLRPETVLTRTVMIRATLTWQTSVVRFFPVWMELKTYGKVVRWLDLDQARQMRQLAPDQHHHVEAELVVVGEAEAPVDIDHLEVRSRRTVVGRRFER